MAMREGLFSWNRSPPSRTMSTSSSCASWNTSSNASKESSRLTSSRSHTPCAMHVQLWLGHEAVAAACTLILSVHVSPGMPVSGNLQTLSQDTTCCTHQVVVCGDQDTQQVPPAALEAQDGVLLSCQSPESSDRPLKLIRQAQGSPRLTLRPCLHRLGPAGSRISSSCGLATGEAVSKAGRGFTILQVSLQLMLAAGHSQ